MMAAGRFPSRRLALVILGTVLTAPAHAASVTTLDFVAASRPANAFLVESDRIAETNAGGRLAAFARREAPDRARIVAAFADWAAAERLRAARADLGPSLDMLGPIFGPSDHALAAVVAPDRAPVLRQLAALTGAEFDALYIASQADALRLLVAFYVDFIKNGDDETLRRLAVDDLPRARRLLADVERLR